MHRINGGGERRGVAASFKKEEERIAESRRNKTTFDNLC